MYDAFFPHTLVTHLYTFTGSNHANLLFVYVEMYIRDVQSGICDGAAEPVIVKRTSATALVDGRNGLGPVVGNFCMHLALKKAMDTGVGWVAARGSNHYGIASWYSLQAVERGMIVSNMYYVLRYICLYLQKIEFSVGSKPVMLWGSKSTEFVVPRLNVLYYNNSFFPRSVGTQ
jgi:hypothetical protein